MTDSALPPLEPWESEALTVRRAVRDALRAELVGPLPGLPAIQTGFGEESYHGEEILRPQDSPRIRYGAGILFPQRTPVSSQDEINANDPETARQTADALADVDEVASRDGSGGPSTTGAESEADTEQEVNRANEYLPSAIGLSVLTRVPESGLRIQVRTARYTRREMPGLGRTDGKGYQPYMAWWRVPIATLVDVSADSLLTPEPTAHEYPVSTGMPDLSMSVHVFTRPVVGAREQPDSYDRSRLRMITVTLLNRTVSAAQRPADTECLFQCRFAIDSSDGSHCFLPYPERDADFEAGEEASLRLLYRHRRVYAVGHGCAPDWADPSLGADISEWATGDASKVPATGSHLANQEPGVTRVWSESIPVYEVPPVLPTEIAGLDLSMRALAATESEDPIALCRRLAAAYEQWIEEQQRRIAGDELPEEMKSTARAHVARSIDCFRRVERGIALLVGDTRVRRAFTLMNRAMLMQQMHYRLSSDEARRRWVREGANLRPDRSYVPPDYNASSSKWRPFQLAFILMNLHALADPTCDERLLVDVIWFPTGGGKTEAYLGLTAFSLFLRRLRRAGNAGTAVLMRYTLRLLTAQQYQRAASLICACEVLRRNDPQALGDVPITVGLWVGSALTPNREDTAVLALKRLLREGTGNPFVVLTCPWCGVAMGPVKSGEGYQTPGYRQLARPRRVRFVCDDPQCEFSDDRGLPLLVIDEHMYSEPPTLVIGTVDKFALLPWYPDAAALFGIGTTDGYTPPELIVQDELHLISGPLGSMVGHYESLIDTLCRGPGDIPAKIVASTATISRAAEQVEALYARRTFLFPPQGLDSGDSFFARERPDRPGRMYVGVFATGLPSQQTAMVRTLSTLLQAPASTNNLEARAIDPFWTLIAYFNSIRELGSAATLVSADIREYLGVTHERLGLIPMWGTDRAAMRRFITARGSLELTGRVSGSAVTAALQQLFTHYTGRDAVREGSKTAPHASGGTNESPVDVCLATNMIQVGLDVPRLGLMVVAGQPKTTSEYIQATSRVGRQVAGLVVTLYSPSKPRDRSHYEHFRAYHESIYRYVEPTSVTPFALPVRERALHALVVALVRFWSTDTLRDRPGSGPSPALLERIRTTLLERVAVVDEAELAETQSMIDRFVDEWQRLPPSRYGDFRPPDQTVPLMYPSGSQPLPVWQDRAWATPSSLRNVDAECDARVLTSFPRD